MDHHTFWKNVFRRPPTDCLGSVGGGSIGDLYSTPQNGMRRDVVFLPSNEPNDIGRDWYNEELKTLKEKHAERYLTNKRKGTKP